MTKQYRIDVRFYGTAYIKAESPEDALEKARAMKDLALQDIPDGEYDEIIVKATSDEEDPDVCISPVMTCYGPDDDFHAEEL